MHCPVKGASMTTISGRSTRTRSVSMDLPLPTSDISPSAKRCLTALELTNLMLSTATRLLISSSFSMCGRCVVDVVIILRTGIRILGTPS